MAVDGGRPAFGITPRFDWPQVEALQIFREQRRACLCMLCKVGVGELVNDSRDAGMVGRCRQREPAHAMASAAGRDPRIREALGHRAQVDVGIEVQAALVVQNEVAEHVGLLRDVAAARRERAENGLRVGRQVADVGCAPDGIRPAGRVGDRTGCHGQGGRFAALKPNLMEGFQYHLNYSGM